MITRMKGTGFIFIPGRAVQGSASGQRECRCAIINKRWIHIDDELMKRNGALSECMYLKDLTLKSCQYLLCGTRETSAWMLGYSLVAEVGVAFGYLAFQTCVGG